ncbi:MAG: glycosyltransferase family 4 protein [Acidimicrobiales bacterium]
MTLRVALDALPLAGQPSGIGAAARGLIEALVEREDVEVSTYAVARKAFTARREVPAGIRFRGLPMPTRLAQVAWQFGRFPKAETVAGAADVVHGTNYVVPPTRKAAAVVTVNDLTAVRYPELCTPVTLTYPALVRKAVSRGAFVHVPSDFVRDEVVQMLDVPDDVVRVVHWGIPPVPEPTTRPPVEPPYVLALGTVEPRKDYPTLVEAFHALSARTPGLRLVVAGADGWGAETLTGAVAARRLEDRVVRLGYVNEEERNSLLWNASALAYPSLYEGFGFPPLEAMSAGVPVVATRAGAVPQVVGNAAVLVPARDVAAFAEALGRALTDIGFRDQMIARGRERASLFSWARTADEMVGLYHDAVRAGRPRGEQLPTATTSR